MGTTTHWEFEWPEGSDPISDGDNVIQDLAEALDDVSKYAQGDFADRGTAADRKSGFFYFAEDAVALYVSDGTNWQTISLGAPTPVGSLVDYAGGPGDPADTRWLLADGRSVSRATYPALFTAIGTTYGEGDTPGSTMALPDFRARVAVGPNSSPAMGSSGRMASNNTLGASGGSELVTLVTGNLPAHTHGFGTLATSTSADHQHGATGLTNDTHAGHTHAVGTYSFSGTTNSAGSHSHNALAGYYVAASAGGGYQIPSGSGTNHNLFGTTASGGSHSHTVSGTISGASASSGSHTHVISGSTASAGSHSHTVDSGATASTGSGTPFNAMIPYLVCNKLIKVA